MLSIERGAKVTLQDLTITKGRAVGEDFPANAGGGFSNRRGTLTLQADSLVSDKTADRGGGIYTLGGRVTVDASALVCNNTLSGNQCGGVFTGPCPNPRDGICPAG